MKGTNFDKKVYAMQTEARERRTENNHQKKMNLDDVFKDLGFTLGRIEKEDKQNEKKEQKNKGNDKKKKRKEEKAEKKQNEGLAGNGSGEELPSPTAKPLIPSKPFFEEDVNLGKSKFRVDEKWLLSKMSLVPEFPKDSDYLISFGDNMFTEFIKGSPGLHKKDMTVEINVSKDERVFVFDESKEKVVGFINCVSDRPIGVARFSNLTFAMIRIES